MPELLLWPSANLTTVSILIWDRENYVFTFSNITVCIAQKNKLTSWPDYSKEAWLFSFLVNDRLFLQCELLS